MSASSGRMAEGRPSPRRRLCAAAWAGTREYLSHYVGSAGGGLHVCTEDLGCNGHSAG